MPSLFIIAIICILFCVFNKVHGSYSVIPNFDFSGNTIGASTTDPASACDVDQTCIGYNNLGGYGYCKNEFTNPGVVQGTNFLAHGVEFGMKFIAVVDWNTPNYDTTNSPYDDVPTIMTMSRCAYLCTTDLSCVGTVFYINTKKGINSCWLKTSFNNRQSQAGYNMLIPVGNGGCPISYATSNTCLNSIPYNKIPNFDLTGNDLHSTTTSNSAYTDCESYQSCIGFNSNGYTKNGIGLPTITTLANFFVPIVSTGTKFIVFQAFDNAGTSLAQSTTGKTISGCAKLCSDTTGCAGAVSDGSSYCWLKKNFLTPSQATNRIMLIPLKLGASCPTGTVASTTNSNLCIYCQVGYIPSASGIGSCDSCPAGKSANPGVSLCTSCAAGQSSAAGGPCVACAAGQLSVSGGLCRNCLPGSSSTAGATACADCVAGQSSTAGGLCTACAAGWFSLSGGLCYNCPYGISYSSSSVSSGQCVDSYTKIPQFNFNGNTIGISSAIDATYSSCQSDATCIGFNSDNYYKGDFNSPYLPSLYDSSIRSVDYYIHAVGYGMQFIQVRGWNVVNGNLVTYTSYTPTKCAYQCTIVANCVAAVFSSSNTCYLKSGFVTPSQDGSATMLLPVGKGNCPDSVISAGDCIDTIPYVKIPGFDFVSDSNVISGQKTNLNIAYTSCDADITCIGFNSNRYCKNDFGTPTISASVDFYAHAVRFGMQFVLVKGFNSAGIGLGLPFVSTPSACAYKCTTTTSCVGAVMDGNNFCYMKKSFVAPNAESNMKLLIPAGNGGCLFSAVSAANCIQSIAYNKIPNFDFGGYDIAAKGSVAPAYLSCEGDSTCIGFNTNGFYKRNFSSPQITLGSDFYIHGLTYGMNFFRVKGWDSVGATISYPSNILILSPSVCAWQCSVTPGCIGAVSDGGSGCSLKSSFTQPVKTAGKNMLIPVGNAGCPLGIGSNCITPSPLCSKYLPGGSLMSLLINAESTFKQLSVALANDPLNQDKFNDGRMFLNSFLNTEVDLNGDGHIVTQEVMAALKFRSVDAKGLSLNFNVWNCQQDFTGCASNSVDKSRIYNDALNCYLSSGKHLFDCSGVSIINNLGSEFPKSDNNAFCQKSDQTWYPSTYHKPYTNWTYTPAPTSSGQSSIGANGNVCIYSNGYNIDGAPFNSVDIGRGKSSGFQDPNRNVNVTSYRRVYCIAVLLNDGTYSYECSQGLFHVSIANLYNHLLLLKIAHLISICLYIGWHTD